MSKPYHRNISLLYLYSIFIKRVSMPIIILYFLLNNLSFSEIGILAAVTAIIHMTTEIHGGIFADIHGKKTSLILHSIFGALTMFFYFIGDSFSWFLVASIMYGISGAFITGTRNALLYDTLTKMKRTPEFKKYNGRVLLYSHVVNAMVLLAIPAIYVLNVKLPFLIGIGFFLTSLIIAFFFIETPLTKRSKITLGTYNIKFSEAMREVKRSKNLLSFILLYMITASFVFVGSEFIQPLLKISGLNVVYFGIVYALMRGITGLGGSITNRLEKRFTWKGLLFFGIVGILVSFLGFSIGAGLIIVFFVLLLKLSEGFNRIILEDEINKKIKSGNRTTILSMSTLSEEIATACLVFAFGVAADIVGVQGIFNYAIILFLLAVFSVFVFMKNAKE